MPEAITKDELKTLLEESNGSTFVSFTSKTTPRMRKTDNPYWDSESREWSIRKISRIHGIIGFYYSNSVNNQLERENKEPDFEPEPRRWGERIEGTPLVHHIKDGEDKYYLEVKVERVMDTFFKDTNGNFVSRGEIEEFLYDSSAPSTQDKLDEKVILRDYSLGSIVRLTHNLETYEVIDNL